MKNSLALCLVLIASAVSTICAGAVPLPDNEMRSSLDELTTQLEAQSFSGIIVVASADEVLYVGAPGAANPVTGEPFTLTTQIDIGSVSKTVTSLAASQLILSGDLDPAATLADYFPESIGPKRQITLHDLLTNGAGFPGAVGPDEVDASREEFVSLALASGLLFEPGQGYEYSNVGFGLVAAMIEQETRRPFAVWVTERMQSLGLSETGYANVYRETRSERNPKGQPIHVASWGGHAAPGWHLVGNGGMISTPRDLIELGRTLLRAPAPLKSLMLAPHNPEDPTNASFYGYGIVNERSDRFGQLYWHNGGNPWFSTDLYVVADHGLIVVVHGNNPDFRNPIQPVLSALFTHAIHNAVPVEPVPFDGEGESGRLAQAFLDAVGADDPVMWRAFIDQRTTEAFRSLMTIDEHLDLFAQLHRDFESAEVSTWRDERDGNRGVARLGVALSGVSHELSVHYEVIDGRAYLRGISLE